MKYFRWISVINSISCAIINKKVVNFCLLQNLICSMKLRMHHLVETYGKFCNNCINDTSNHSNKIECIPSIFEIVLIVQTRKEE